MTQEELLERVEFWRVRLAPEWRVTVRDQPPDWKKGHVDYYATCQTDNDYHHANMYFTLSARTGELGDLDKIIVHELLHLLTREMRSATDMVDMHVPDFIGEAMKEAHRRAEEQLVERVARIITLTEHPDGLVYGTASDD